MIMHALTLHGSLFKSSAGLFMRFWSIHLIHQTSLSQIIIEQFLHSICNKIEAFEQFMKAKVKGLF